MFRNLTLKDLELLGEIMLAALGLLVPAALLLMFLTT
jgi:hypothetical protein